MDDPTAEPAKAPPAAAELERLVGPGGDAARLGAASPEQRRRAIHGLQRTAGNAAVNRMLRKAASDQAASTPDPERVADQLGSGRPLDPGVNATMGAAMGADFGSVRVHDDPASGQLTSSLGARAITVGEHIAFAPRQYAPGTPVGDALIAHELAHVTQQRTDPSVARTALPEAQFEADADRAAAGALHVLYGAAPRTRGIRAALRTGLRLQRCGVSKPMPDPKTVVDAATASKAVDAYLSESKGDRREAIKKIDKSELARILRLLPGADQIDKYGDALQEIGRTVEEEETRAASGMTDDQMAVELRDWRRKKAEDAAKAAAAAKAPKDAPPPPPPTEAEVEAERKKQVEETSIPKAKSHNFKDLSDAEKAAWQTRAEKAIDKVVNYAKAHHPELGITKANFTIAFEAVEARGAGVVAAGSPAQIGTAFVIAAELNPAYVMDVVVHEVFGHPGYGTYGSEYHLALFDKAMTSMPGYKKPAEGTPERDTELDAYAYQETETYAVLRGFPYRTAPTAADAPKVPNLDTKTLVDWHVDNIVKQWPPKLVGPILRGLRMRLVVDPRITGAAIKVFDDAMVNAKLDAATISAVKK